MWEREVEAKQNLLDPDMEICSHGANLFLIRSITMCASEFATGTLFSAVSI